MFIIELQNISTPAKIGIHSTPHTGLQTWSSTPLHTPAKILECCSGFTPANRSAPECNPPPLTPAKCLFLIFPNISPKIENSLTKAAFYLQNLACLPKISLKLRIFLQFDAKISYSGVLAGVNHSGRHSSKIRSSTPLLTPAGFSECTPNALLNCDYDLNKQIFTGLYSRVIIHG